MGHPPWGSSSCESLAAIAAVSAERAASATAVGESPMSGILRSARALHPRRCTSAPRSGNGARVERHGHGLGVERGFERHRMTETRGRAGTSGGRWWGPLFDPAQAF